MKLHVIETATKQQVTKIAPFCITYNNSKGDEFVTLRSEATQQGISECRDSEDRRATLALLASPVRTRTFSNQNAWTTSPSQTGSLSPPTPNSLHSSSPRPLPPSSALPTPTLPTPALPTPTPPWTTSPRPTPPWTTSPWPTSPRPTSPWTTSPLISERVFFSKKTNFSPYTGSFRRSLLHRKENI